MSQTTEKLQALLDGLAPVLPLHVNEITTPDAPVELATIRGRDGYPVLLPHPEAQSILSGPREIFAFIEQAPNLIADALAIIASYEENNKPAQENKPTPRENSTRRGGNVEIPQ